MPGGSTRRRASHALVVGLLALSCVLVSASAAHAELSFRRLHGAPIHFDETPRVWCGPWEPGVSSRPSIHVELRDAGRSWQMSAVQHDVEIGHRIEFPSDVISDRPHGVLFFVGVLKPVIEASTNEEEASGSMVFSQASCEFGAPVAFRINAVLGSELFNGTRVRVSGGFAGLVGEPPTSSPRT
jgi:hypothetical protein